ncbi:MAG: acetate kinase [Candidatus Gygaella obscura]|nr:acetate kinase [Candidatus Gygaella obscura]
MKILVINSGSSSIKYRLYDMPKERLFLKGMIDKIGEGSSCVKNHHEGFRKILKKIDGVDAVGHRVVHGAEEFQKPIVIKDNIIKRLKKYNILAPLHNPANLSGVIACKKLLKNIAQVAVFDTSFHQSIPDYAYIYGLPFSFYKKHKIRRYGFHGTSHHYVAEEASKLLKKPLNKLNLITCHLGNGCSMAAVKKGKCIDTTMGFTPQEGLLMGTRAGDMDTAILIYLMEKLHLGIEQINRIINKESGLKGISGVSNDMRKIEQAIAKGNKRAKLAREIFIYRIKKYIGAYSAIMGGVNAVIFTAGIGENQIRLRGDIIKGLFDYLKHKPKVMVISTNEELMIARQTYKAIKKGVK